MKRIILIILSFMLISCSGPTESRPQKVNIYGEVAIIYIYTIKYSGRVEMEYNGAVLSSTLANLHRDGIYNIYDFKFENVELAKNKEATFIVKLTNGFGAETVHADTTFMPTSANNDFRLYIGVY